VRRVVSGESIDRETNLSIALRNCNLNVVNASGVTIHVLEPHDLTYLDGRSVMIVVAHADDAALFCGGTIAAMSRAGARMTLVRVTNDDTDSVGLSPTETVDRNARELALAASILGIGTICDFGYPSDQMSDVPEVELRERLIRVMREIKPFAVLTFDPHGGGGEDNQDHLRVAQAMDEAFWTSMFDKHHPEHFDVGLAPHGVVERWYFARPPSQVSHIVDTSQVLDAKCDAAAQHTTMLGNLVEQLHLMAKTEGRELPRLADIGEDLPNFIRSLVRAGAEATGAKYEVPAAEEFRRVRYSGFEDVVNYLEQHYLNQKGDG